jgi:hypothetical protein
MNHTEAFNAIMERNKPAPRKRKQAAAIFKQITPRDNMNELQKDLSKCLINGNIVTLPFERLPNYDQVRKALLNAGASYKKNSFVFPNDAQPYIERLMDGGSVNIKKEFQFFATPAELANKMVELADVNNYQRILEPSAGQGAIIKAIREKCCINVDCCELMDINRAVLEKMEGCTVIAEDFLKVGRFGFYDRIIANPPFNKNQDIDHIKLMHKHLKEGGRIVTIASNSWRRGSQKKQVEFRSWLDDINAVVEDIEAGTFKESGTNIAACIIIIDK